MKIGYYPEGPLTLASSRLRVYYPAQALMDKGHTVIIDPDRDQLALLDVLIVQKNAWRRWVPEMNHAFALGKKVIWDVDDCVDPPEGMYTHITIDTPRKLHRYSTAKIVYDCLDVPPGAAVKQDHALMLQRLVGFCGFDNVYHFRAVAHAADHLGLQLTLITDLSRATFDFSVMVGAEHWTLDSIDAQLIRYDLSVCPYVLDGPHDLDWVTSKSANKPLKAWGLGLPVAGSPIPSYVEAGLEYQAFTVRDWITVLEELADVRQRLEDAKRGWAVAQAYTAERMAVRWLEVFEA